MNAVTTIGTPRAYSGGPPPDSSARAAPSENLIDQTQPSGIDMQMVPSTQPRRIIAVLRAGVLVVLFVASACLVPKAKAAPADLEALGFLPTGQMGDGQAGRTYVQCDSNCTERPHSHATCQRWSYQLGSSNWAAVAWQYPRNNWGDKPGKDLSDLHVDGVEFFARAARDGVAVEFFSGGNTDPLKRYLNSLTEERIRVTLTIEWKKVVIRQKGKSWGAVICPFGWAVDGRSNPQGVRFYLEDVRFHEEGSPPSLHDAAAEGDLTLVRQLIDLGADVNEQLESDGSTPLYCAVVENHAEIAALLLAHKANPDVGKQGVTPLCEAASAGRLPLLRTLLGAGADVNRKSLLGMTALKRACAHGHLPVVELLVEKGADVEAGAGTIGTALHDAAQCGDVNMLRFLIAHGADVNAADLNGKTARYVAEFFRNADAVQYLDALPATKRPTARPTPPAGAERQTYSHGGVQFSYARPLGWKPVEVESLVEGAICLMSPTLKRGSPTLLICALPDLPMQWSLEWHRQQDDDLHRMNLQGFKSKNAAKIKVDGYKALAWVTMFNGPLGMHVCQYHTTIKVGDHAVDFTLQAAEDDFPMAVERAKGLISSINFSK